MQLDMGIIKIEVSLPEAVRAIEEFRDSRVRAFETIAHEVRGAVGGAINQLLHTEMTMFLGKPDQVANKRNGYEDREYAIKGIGAIRLRMPIDRRREFKSEIIRPNEQMDPRLKEDMAVLHLAGLSKRTMAMMSKRVLGIMLAIEPGTKDNVEAWRAVFAELAKRGLDFQAVRIGIMDGLPGLEKLFRETFPQAITQRCWVHALRNALAKAPQRHREAFKKLAHRVMYAGSANSARVAFTELKAAMSTDGERAVACIEKDLDSLLSHYQFDKPLWRALKTTNPIERVNRELKRRTKSMDSLGESTLSVLVAFTALRLEYGWATTRIDLERFENLVSVKRINQIEQAVESLLH